MTNINIDESYYEPLIRGYGAIYGIGRGEKEDWLGSADNSVLLSEEERKLLLS